MSEEHSSSRKALHNNTYIKNKSCGYPAGADNIDDSLNFPNEQSVVDLGIAFSALIETNVGCYCSFSFFASLDTNYIIKPNEGVGSGVVQGPDSVIGDDTIHIVTIQVTAIGAGGYQLGVEGASVLTILEEQKIDSVVGSGDRFGSSVAIYQDTCVIGSPNDYSGGTAGGTAHVFTRTGNVWTLQASLSIAPEDRGSYTYFGNSVALYGNTLAVGAYRDSKDGANVGAVHVFTRVGDVWTLEERIACPQVTDNAFFGSSVSLQLNDLVIGALGIDSVWVFTRSSTIWSVQQKIVSHDGTLIYFGGAVSISGDELAVGARNEDTNGTASGAVYTYERSGVVWTFVNKLISTTPTSSGLFGIALCISSTQLIVGAAGDDSETPAGNSGAAYIFTKVGGVWVFTAKLVGDNPTTSEYFGGAVSIIGTTSCIVGGTQSDRDGYKFGSAVIFKHESGYWEQEQRLDASLRNDDSHFGCSVSSSNGSYIIGAYGDETGGWYSGAAYIYKDV